MKDLLDLIIKVEKEKRLEQKNKPKLKFKPKYSRAEIERYNKNKSIFL